MSELRVRITLESDPMYGPLAERIKSYSPEEFEKYVILGSSDPGRQRIIRENIASTEFVCDQFAETGATIRREIADIEEMIESGKFGRDKFRIDEPSLARKFEKFGKPRLSGPEFAELGKIVITHGTLGAGATTVAVAFIKAVKEVAVKWLDGRGKKKVKVSLGPGKSIEVAGPIDAAKIKQLTEFLQNALPPTKASKANQSTP